MARNIDGLSNEFPGPPTAGRLQQWGRILVSRHAGLRLYQWLWIGLCVVAALAVTAPRILSQPVVYETAAEVRFDVTRYPGLYTAEGEPSTDFHIAMCDALHAVAGYLLPTCALPSGPPDQQLDFVLSEPGIVQVATSADTAAEARRLADRGAAELARQIRAAGGREVLRNLLGWETVAAMRGEEASSEFRRHLRAIIVQDAFPMSRPVEPVAARIDVDALPRAEQLDLTRALEARYDLWTFEINTHNTVLDERCGTASMDAGPRQQALQVCAATFAAQGEFSVQAELALLNRAVESRHAIAGALEYMLREQHTVFQVDEPAAAYRIGAALPTDTTPRHIVPLLTLAGALGLGFGVLGVAVDRGAGVMPKMRELWAYRELIRNLILRDLRSRYKGSALGYLWTQIAPLLMMLVFLFVFTLLIPQAIPLFPVFLIVALLPWNYCAEAVSGGTRSVLDNANLIEKVFFPREVLPLTSVFSALVNYLLSLPMMFLVMGVTQMLLIGTLNFSWTFAYLPVLIVIQTFFLVGVVLFSSTLAVFFRDTVHLIGIVLQFWFFLTPVFYSLDIVGASLARVIRWLNPMASMVDFYRDILYGSAGVGVIVPTPGLPALDSVLRVVVTTFLVLAFGYWFFQRHSGQFGEEL
jgi:lipopolysaccharide transport system permease protein